MATGHSWDERTNKKCARLLTHSLARSATANRRRPSASGRRASLPASQLAGERASKQSGGRASKRASERAIAFANGHSERARERANGQPNGPLKALGWLKALNANASPIAVLERPRRSRQTSCKSRSNLQLLRRRPFASLLFIFNPSHSPPSSVSPSHSRPPFAPNESDPHNKAHLLATYLAPKRSLRRPPNLAKLFSLPTNWKLARTLQFRASCSAPSFPCALFGRLNHLLPCFRRDGSSMTAQQNEEEEDKLALERSQANELRVEFSRSIGGQRTRLLHPKLGANNNKWRHLVPKA